LKESLIDSDKKRKIYEDDSPITKSKKLTRSIIKLSMERPIIPICFFGSFITRINTIMLTSYMTLWT